MVFVACTCREITKTQTSVCGSSEGGIRDLVPPRMSSSTTSRASPTLLSERQLNGQYNAWLHTRLWRERIEAVMDRYTSVGPDDEVTASTNQRRRARRSSSAADSSTGEHDDDVVKDPPRSPEQT